MLQPIASTVRHQSGYRFQGGRLVRVDTTTRIQAEGKITISGVTFHATNITIIDEYLTPVKGGETN